MGRCAGGHWQGSPAIARHASSPAACRPSSSPSRGRFACWKTISIRTFRASRRRSISSANVLSSSRFDAAKGRKVAKVVVVTSGKGGVGKTTTSASFASGLALRGHKTAVLDFDVGLRNLDLIMGCERRVVYDFVNVINQEATLTQALIKDKRTENLYVLPASQTRDKDALTAEGVGRVLDE